MRKIREPTATCDSHNEDVFQSRYLFLFRTCLNPVVLEHISTKIKICSRPAKGSLTCGHTGDQGCNLRGLAVLDVRWQAHAFAHTQMKKECGNLKVS